LPGAVCHTRRVPAPNPHSPFQFPGPLWMSDGHWQPPRKRSCQHGAGTEPDGLFTSINQGGAVALIKHAYVSARVSCASIKKDGDKDQDFILLDGFNNPGFSGGPVVAPDMFLPFSNIRAQKLIGVVGGFVQVASAN